MAHVHGGFETVWKRATPYARLVRLPNLFTAPPDVIAGAAVAAVVVGSVEPTAVAGLALASMALYGAGTTLNDYFDAPADAVDRPERPIPSGDVSRSTALMLGGLLLLGGVIVAGWATGLLGAAVAMLIALAVVAYDGVLKGGPVGFLVMGGTRGLNVMLGTTAAGQLPLGLPQRAFVPPIAVATYIVAVTAMAERETEGGNRTAVAVTLATAGVAAIVAVGYVLWIRPEGPIVAIAIALSGVFMLWTGRALWRAYVQPVPGTIGPAVGTCVLALVVLESAFAAVAGWSVALVTLAFLVPAAGLSRTFDVT